MSAPRLCYWSVGDGECALMLQTLVASFRRVGMTDHYYAFSDRIIEGAETHLISSLDKRGYFFKFAFLQSKLLQLDYDYFIYLDADTFFVRKPPKLLPLMHGSPIHFFLESLVTVPTRRQEWWNCPLEVYVEMLRGCGVTTKDIYCLNGGFFIIAKSAIKTACGLAEDFFEYAKEKGYVFPDEPLWNYVMHMLCDDLSAHLLKNYTDVWCSDWKGEFADRLPDGKPWEFEDYMTGESQIVNPAIVHALRSKKLLIENGKIV